MTVAIALLGCSNKSEDVSGKPTHSVAIGTPLDAASLFDLGHIDEKSYFFVDETTQRIIGVDLEKVAVKASLSLPESSTDHSIRIGPDDAYVLDFTERRLDIVKMDGTRTKSSLKFQGIPTSAAFDPTSGTMVMVDDLNSIGIIRLDASGEIIDEWLGGSLVSSKMQIIAGEIDASGRLVLVADGKTILIIDIDKTLAESEWNYESFDLDMSDLDWAAGDPQIANFAIISGRTGAAIIDLDKKEETDRLSYLMPSKPTPININPIAPQTLTGASSTQYSTSAPSSPQEMIDYAADYAATDTEETLPTYTYVEKSQVKRPHLLAKSSEDGRLYIFTIGSDGKFVRRIVPDIGTANPSQSFLSEDGENLIGFENEDSTTEILAMRISDGLVSQKISVKGEKVISFGEKYAVANAKSPLGFLTIYDFANDAQHEIKGFNFEYLRDSAKGE